MELKERRVCFVSHGLDKAREKKKKEGLRTAPDPVPPFFSCFRQARGPPAPKDAKDGFGLTCSRSNYTAPGHEGDPG